jgi:Rps23 Pro-64 3,4-dihydroxylase Tpa1-like proline 4-hydroxylase
MSLQGNTFEVVDRIGNASPWIPRATGNMRAPARFVVCVYDPDLETLIDQTEIETSFGIEVFDDFIDKMVQAEILEYAKHVQWLPSHVADGNGQLVIGSGAEIRSSNSIPILSNEHFWAQCIRRRVCEIEKCSDESLELMQIVRYRVGDFFGPHFDGGAGVARKKTYLIYVNDDFGGGETRFPRISQSVRPVAGRCIAWENVLRDGRVRWQAEHQGMPVTEGQKVAINVWVR